ncbi:NADP-dependent oxidoreductase [Aeromicrobium sp. YIM 150415]|uniref:NADP-dependent oxidoreductase n=1 Tax=Aeromicrobium sp. YIM 150415 TaxID=2803912 RepID=UPI0019656D32|nr:NADP-dependent oxidoreductase [Aeromicrobium sp. YIM 150415]MBM9464097.1 NADP-dependent oxidoreductase [Aeromicrobium sp. YIM 150415]
MTSNSRVLLASRPTGSPSLNDFSFDSPPCPSPGLGQVLLRVVYLSLDPYLRGRMGSSVSHASSSPPVPLGTVMQGGTVAAVVESRSSELAEGDLVLSASGWQEYAVADARQVRRIDPDRAPISTALGVLGMPGLTAYGGLTQIGRPQPGEVLVVAAATGTVGATVGQLARHRGARVVGIAGGKAKVSWLEDAGFDEAIDHRAPDFEDRLAAATPNGIDIYFENVGGRVWSAVEHRLNRYARVPVSGVASAYNSDEASTGDIAALMSGLVTRSITLKGFVFTDFEAVRPEFEKEVSTAIRNDQLVYHEEVAAGLEQAPAAFLAMLEGRHLGKQLVQVAPDPTASS